MKKSLKNYGIKNFYNPEEEKINLNTITKHWMQIFSN